MKYLKGAGYLTLLFGVLIMFQCSDDLMNPDNSDQLAAINAKYGNGNGGGVKEPDPDSDRPPWAGGNPDENPNKKGNNNPGDKRGEDFGDLLIILRDESGIPITTSEGHVQPIAFIVQEYIDVGGVLTPVLLEEDGFPIEATQVNDPSLNWIDEQGVFVFGFTEEGDLYVPPDLYIAPAEVHFGRINLARAPQGVLNQALGEALKTLSGVEVTLDFCGRLVGVLDGAPKTIDSPRENLALYQELMKTGGVLAGVVLPTTATITWLDIAASCIAAASDKTGHVSIDEIQYLNMFLEIDEAGFFDFSGYTHDRTVYQSREIRMVLLEGDYDACRNPVAIWNVHYNSNPDTENDYSGISIFTEKWSNQWRWGNSPWTNIAGFCVAADDAVQVLEFIHGDSNIQFPPEDCTVP